MPGSTFLPLAGPFGTMLGIFAGGMIMAIIAWNYHYMINRLPGPGGAYVYAMKAFGGDHGFLCAWFLCFTYMAIVWMDATILAVIADYLFGNMFRFCRLYSVASFDVSLGHVLLSVAAIIVAAAICCRRRFAGGAQTVLAVIFAAGILACFVAALFHHEGGLKTLAPAFATDGTPPLSQFLRIVALAPWLFVGFEAISHSSAEFRFPLRKSFGIMVSALCAAVAAYVLLAFIPVLVPGNYANWADYVANLGAQQNEVAFNTASRSLGNVGAAVICLTLVGAVFTNLIGNTVAASRLIAAMADDNALPQWFGRRNADGSPQNAILAIAVLSLGIIALGRTAIGVIVDLALLGAAFAYAYTSAATLKMARKENNWTAKATGLCGLVFAIVLILLFILPNFTSNTTLMSTGSYLILVCWCIAGLLAFLSVFRHDKSQRFGKSTVVWICLFAAIILMSLMWIRQTTYYTTQKVFNNIVSFHAADCRESGLVSARVHKSGKWFAELRHMQKFVNRSIMRNSFVQSGLTILALALMMAIYATLRRRERDMEREKAKAKSYFFSTVSHDIRTPLNAIIGFSEMLKAGVKTDSERKQALDAILVSSRTLLGLINDVLDLSKLESGKMAISPEPTDCYRLMHVVMDAFRVSGNKPGLELRCNVGEMPLLMLDPQRLRQIVFNLVGNAVKFTEKGHVELRASFDLPKGSKAGVFRLEVEDTGCGISEEDKLRIGSAYVQVGSTMSRNSGTGLGLAICGQLAAAMGGTLCVDSTLGHGSTFSLTLPAVTPAPASAEAADTHASAPSKATADAAPCHTRHILLVDDSNINLMVLKAFLKNMGDFRIETATDGRKALTTLEASGSDPFDLVLTDMWMPNMDGTALVKAIRANPALASLRVISVTADVEVKGKEDELGFDGLLLKPVTAEKLREILADGR